jgi:hypothetical protein
MKKRVETPFLLSAAHLENVLLLVGGSALEGLHELRRAPPALGGQLHERGDRVLARHVLAAGEREHVGAAFATPQLLLRSHQAFLVVLDIEREGIHVAAPVLAQALALGPAHLAQHVFAKASGDLMVR